MIPETVISIGSTAFNACDQLVITSIQNPVLNEYCRNNQLRFVCVDNINVREELAETKTVIISGGRCGDNAAWQLHSDGVLYVFGTDEVKERISSV